MGGKNDSHRRRSRSVLAACVAAVVIALAGTGLALALAHDGGGAAALQRPGAGPSTSVADWRFPTDMPAAGCAASKVFDASASTPPADLARQRATVASVTGATGEGWRVAYVRPTALGVVALVTGDVAVARPALGSRGAWRVAPLSTAGGTRAPSADDQVESILQNLLLPVAHRLDQRFGQRPGFTGLALWVDQGAVLMTWKAPVPPAIERLATRSRRGSVIVESAPFSEADLRAAQARVIAATRQRTRTITAIGLCADGSGLQVGVLPGTPADVRRSLAARLTRLVAVPVEVVPLGPAEASAGSASRP